MNLTAFPPISPPYILQAKGVSTEVRTNSANALLPFISPSKQSSYSLARRVSEVKQQSPHKLSSPSKEPLYAPLHDEIGDILLSAKLPIDFKHEIAERATHLSEMYKLNPEQYVNVINIFKEKLTNITKALDKEITPVATSIYSTPKPKKNISHVNKNDPSQITPRKNLIKEQKNLFFYILASSASCALRKDYYESLKVAFCSDVSEYKKRLTKTFQKQIEEELKWIQSHLGYSVCQTKANSELAYMPKRHFKAAIQANQYKNLVISLFDFGKELYTYSTSTLKPLAKLPAELNQYNKIAEEIKDLEQEVASYFSTLKKMPE